MSKQVVIVGYHRSGTSAMGQNCQAAGLFVGDDLLGAKPSNPLGHYEDREFFEINEAILSYNYCRWNMTTDFAPVISRPLACLGAEMISKRDAEHEVWGFKDPRVCVLLDYWNGLLPNPKYLICLRHYSACIDSMQRRAIQDYYGMRTPEQARNVGRNVLNHDAACANWCIYMSAVLQFLMQENAPAVVVRIDRLSRDTSVAQRMNEEFGIDLDPIPMSETFRPELFQGDDVAWLNIAPELRLAADRLWGALSERVTLQ